MYQRHYRVHVKQFQSTRPRGARRHSQARGRIRLRGFNPRAHEGRDADLNRPRAWVAVSIHAPTRGATSLTRAPSRAVTCFNPRAHEGRDVSGAMTIAASDLFQSTRPRGARPRASGVLGPRHGFQSTRPRGARHESQGARHHLVVVSIHAPTRGATAKVYSDMHDTSALIRFSRTDEPMIREFCNQDKWQQEKLREPPTLSPSLGVRAATAYLKCIKSPLGHRHH